MSRRNWLYFLVQVATIFTSIQQGPVTDAAVIFNNNINTTNNLQPKSKNNTVITDNSLGNEKQTTSLPIINGTTLAHPYLLENIQNQTAAKSISSTLPTKAPSLANGPTTSTNFTTPRPHPSRQSNKIVLYILIPVGCLLFLCIVFCVIRHAQRMQRKRRLERELLHQYSYPNSEADDLEYGHRILEVESVINTQFSTIDNSEKDFDEDIPQVAVTIGDGAKLVVQDHPSTPDTMEASASFIC